MSQLIANYKEGEFLKPGDPVVLQGGYVYKAQNSYDPNCIGLYWQTIGIGTHSIWGNSTVVAQIIIKGSNRILDENGNLLVGGFKLTREGCDLEPGDLVVTSRIPGFLQRQNIRFKEGGIFKEMDHKDTIIHNYTVGRVLERPIWDLNGYSYNVYGHIL